MTIPRKIYPYFLWLVGLVIFFIPILGSASFLSFLQNKNSRVCRYKSLLPISYFLSENSPFQSNFAHQIPKINLNLKYQLLLVSLFGIEWPMINERVARQDPSRQFPLPHRRVRTKPYLDWDDSQRLRPGAFACTICSPMSSCLEH